MRAQEYATAKQRIFSLLIDYAVAIGIFIAISILVAFFMGLLKIGGNEFSALDENISIALCLLALLFYYGHTFKKEGRTIGERIMKIKIVPAYGDRIGLLSGIVRTLCLAPILAALTFFYTSKEPRKTILDHICLTNTVKT